MTTRIQIHTLTSHSTHNLNRDDLGQPKTVTFLGNQHGRISSQCLKRAVRMMMKTEEELAGKTAFRTRQLPSKVRAYLLKNEIKEKMADAMVLEIASLGMKNKAKAGKEGEIPKTQLIFLTQAEIDEIYQRALTLCQDNENSKFGDTKKLFKQEMHTLFREKKFTDGVDIAMFGRMTTSDVFDNCDAAIQVAHAISTHPIKNEDDFFTAVDDFKEEGDTGSGHMDEKQYNTGIFYKYATVDYELLRDNLAGDAVLTKKVIETFIEAFMLAVPTGSQNSMAAHQHPFSVLITIGNGANTNLTNAFTPASLQKNKKPDLLHTTTAALYHEFVAEQTFYGKRKQVDHALAATRCEMGQVVPTSDRLQSFENLNTLLQTVTQALPGEVE